MIVMGTRNERFGVVVKTQWSLKEPHRKGMYAIGTYRWRHRLSVMHIRLNPSCSCSRPKHAINVVRSCLTVRNSIDVERKQWGRNGATMHGFLLRLCCVIETSKYRVLYTARPHHDFATSMASPQRPGLREERSEDASPVWWGRGQIRCLKFIFKTSQFTYHPEEW